MPCSPASNGLRSRLRSLTAGLLLAAFLPAPALADRDAPFLIHAANVRLVDDVYVLDAISRLQFTPRVIDALNGGVTIHVAFEVEIRRERAWWLDADVAELNQIYSIEFHELTRQYVVANLNTGQRQSFTSVRGALSAMGRLNGFPLMDRVLIDDPQRHYGRVRLRLQREALPLPLRPAALIYGDWNLRSEWITWSFASSSD